MKGERSGSPEKSGGAASPRSSDFVALAKLAQDSFASRRSVEWKINLSIWAGAGAIMYAAANLKVPFIPSWPWAVAVCLIVFAAYALNLYLIATAHATDKAWKHYFIARAEGKSVDRPGHGKTTALGRRQWTWVVVHCAFTLCVLILAVAFLMGVRESPMPESAPAVGVPPR